MTTGSLRVLTLVVSGVPTVVAAALSARCLGAETYGAVALVSILPMALSFVTGATGAPIVRAYARDGAEAALPFIRRSLLVGSIFCVSLILCTSIVAMAGWWPSVLGLSPGELPGLAWAMCALSVLWGLILGTSCAGRVLVGAHRVPVLMLTGLAAGPTNLLYTAALVVLDAPALLFTFGLGIGLAVSACLTWRSASRAVQYPLLRLLWEAVRPWRFELGRARGTGLAQLIAISSFALATQADQIILSHRSTTTQIAVYAILIQFYTPLLNVVASASEVMWPRYIRDSGLIDGSVIARHLGAFSMFGLVLGAVTLVALPPVVPALTGGNVEAPGLAVASFALMLVCRSAQRPLALMIQATRGGFVFNATVASLMLPVNAVLSWFWAPGLGAAGPVLATAASVAVIVVLPSAIAAVRRFPVDLAQAAVSK